MTTPVAARQPPPAGGGKTAQSLRDSPPGPAITDMLRMPPIGFTDVHPLAYKQLCCLLTARPASEGKTDLGITAILWPSRLL